MANPIDDIREHLGKAHTAIMAAHGMAHFAKMQLECGHRYFDVIADAADAADRRLYKAQAIINDELAEPKCPTCGVKMIGCAGGFACVNDACEDTALTCNVDGCNERAVPTEGTLESRCANHPVAPLAVAVMLEAYVAAVTTIEYESERHPQEPHHAKLFCGDAIVADGIHRDPGKSVLVAFVELARNWVVVNGELVSRNAEAETDVEAE